MAMYANPIAMIAAINIRTIIITTTNYRILPKAKKINSMMAY